MMMLLIDDDDNDIYIKSLDNNLNVIKKNSLKNKKIKRLKLYI